MSEVHSDEQLKYQHEQAAAQRFLDWYRQNWERNLVIFQKREAPDFECMDQASGETFGLEVVTAYYDEQIAKGEWDLARGKQESYNSGLLVNPDIQLAEFVNKELSDKCQKQYNVSYPVVLVVDASSPLTSEEDILLSVLPAIQLPAQIPFQEIYLGVALPISTGESSPHEGQYWVWPVYPSPS